RVPAVRGARRLRPAAADLAAAPPDARLPDHRNRHAVAQGQALRSARARAQAAVLPEAVGRPRRGVRRVDRATGGAGQGGRVPGMMKTPACVVARAGGWEWAQRHPAPTAAITGGVIALGTCEIQGSSQATCGIISGSAAALLGVTAAVVMWIVGD